MGRESILCGHGVDDALGPQTTGTTLEDVAEEFPFGMTAMRIGLTIAIEKILRKGEDLLPRRIVELVHGVARVEEIEGPSRERPSRDPGVKLGRDRPMIFQSDFRRQAHG